MWLMKFEKIKNSNFSPQYCNAMLPSPSSLSPSTDSRRASNSGKDFGSAGRFPFTCIDTKFTLKEITNFDEQMYRFLTNGWNSQFHIRHLEIINFLSLLIFFYLVFTLEPIPSIMMPTYIMWQALWVKQVKQNPTKFTFPSTFLNPFNYSNQNSCLKCRLL